MKEKGIRRWAAWGVTILALGAFCCEETPTEPENETRSFLGKWGGYGFANGKFTDPMGVTVTPDGNVYVSDASTSRIQRFTAAGKFLGAWGEIGSRAEGQFTLPSGMGCSADGNVYVADTGNHRIQFFSPEGEFLGGRGFPNPGTDDGFFDSPSDVEVSSAGIVYVADCYNHRIQYFSTDMRFFQGKWGIKGKGNGQFEYPRSVAAKRDGTVFVSESSRIQHFTGGGVVKAVWGSQGTADGQFNRARGIAVARDGTIYIADSGNDRIQYFR